MMIEYEYTEGRHDAPVRVRLDGKIVGTIQPVLNGWRYYPKGSKEGGQAYSTIGEVQRSLEDENEELP